MSSSRTPLIGLPVIPPPSRSGPRRGKCALKPRRSHLPGIRAQASELGHPPTLLVLGGGAPPYKLPSRQGRIWTGNLPAFLSYPGLGGRAQRGLPLCLWAPQPCSPPSSRARAQRGGWPKNWGTTAPNPRWTKPSGSAMRPLPRSELWRRSWPAAKPGYELWRLSCWKSWRRN